MRLSGEDISNIRKKLGLTQQQFARRFHIPYQTLTFWEQEHRSPSGASLVYLCLIQADPHGMADRVEALGRKNRSKRRQLKEVA